MTVRLFDYWRSSASYRVRIALNLKGIAYQQVHIGLLDNEQNAPENRTRNPQGFVPTLEIDGLRLVQSLAIIDYLDARYPDPPLLPADPVARAGQMAQALMIACDVHPLSNMRVMGYLAGNLGADQSMRDAWMHHWMREGLVALESTASAAGPFLGGAAIGVADLCLIPQLYNARRFALDLADYPRLVAADAAAQAIPAVAAAHPDRVKPA
jgi:maleylacetoacetate isomerase